MSWRDHSACKAMDPNDFFPDDGWKTSKTKAALVDQAKQVCARCPVTQQCLDDALADPPRLDLGIRACTDKDERRRIRRERGQALALSHSEKRAAS